MKTLKHLGPTIQANFFTQNRLSHKSPSKPFKKGLFLLTLLVIFTAQAQISYEKGYFIDNSGQRTECLIRNVDWMKNPDSFNYKLSEDESMQSADLNSVSEFGVYNRLKYISATVNIDHSSDDLNQLGLSREPNFAKEKLFLKVLVEGKANLYAFEDNYGLKYFFKTDTSEIQPLVYKRYITADNEVAENNQYKQQLWNKLKHSDIDQKRISKLEYRKKILTDFFLTYNEFHDGEATNLERGKKRDWFSLAVRPGIHYSSVKFQALRSTSFNRDLEVDFDSEISFRFGIELEGILPFNKNKWSIIAEPFYEIHKSELVLNETQTAVVDYKYLGLSVGLRHYLFLNDKSKLFINFSPILAFNSNSGIDFGAQYREIEKGTTVAVGLGFAYNNNFYLEIRHTFDRQLLEYQLSKAQYNGQSLILGYTIF